jgi:hypothetical protein
MHRCSALRASQPANTAVNPVSKLKFAAGLAADPQRLCFYNGITMLNPTRKWEVWSICLLGASFAIFTIAIPLLQESIDSLNASYSEYKFNFQQAALKHSQFVSTYDNGHFLDILLQEKVLSGKHIKAISKIQDRLMSRCQELLADATMSISVDPSDKSDDTVARHTKLRHTSLKELQKKFDTYLQPAPTTIGHKFVVKIRLRDRWKIFMYCAGSAFFILGTFFQFIYKSRRKGSN